MTRYLQPNQTVTEWVQKKRLPHRCHSCQELIHVKNSAFSVHKRTGTQWQQLYFHAQCYMNEAMASRML